MSKIDGGLRALFKAHIPGHWQAVETGATGQGVPDSNYCWDGIEGWVEFKQTHAWAVKFKPTQPGWIYQRVRAGGRVWVAVRRWQCDANDTDELWMVPGHFAGMLSQNGLKSVASHSWILPGPSRRWDWPQVARLLSSPVSVA